MNFKNPKKLKAAAVQGTSQLSKVGTGTNYVAREHPWLEGKSGTE